MTHGLSETLLMFSNKAHPGLTTFESMQLMEGRTFVPPDNISNRMKH